MLFPLAGSAGPAARTAASRGTKNMAIDGSAKVGEVGRRERQERNGCFR